MYLGYLEWRQASYCYRRELGKLKTLELIKERIKETPNGYLYFDEYMDLSLYSDQGYFNSGLVRSTKEGDFLTSSEVSEYFGKTIAKWIVNKSDSSVINILELGAGSGSLSKSIKDSTLDRELNFHFIEKSDTAIKSLVDLFPESIVSKTTEESSLLELKDLIVIGNEILDNVPCSIAIIDDGRWKEKAVSLLDEELEYCLVEPRKQVIYWLRSNFKEEKPDFEVEVQINAETYIQDVLERFSPLAILLIDYGYLKEDRAAKPYKSLLRTYKEHHIGPDPLLYPGETDITYDINFSSMNKAIDSSLYQKKISTQYEFLYENGLNDYVEDLTRRRSKEEGLDLVKTNSDLLSIKTISDKSGLGSFYAIEATRK